MTRRRAEIAKLLAGSIRDGTFPPEALEPLARTGAADEIAASLGALSSKPEILLVTVLADDSGSMADDIPAVCTGQSRLLTALRQTDSSADVLVHTRYLNGPMLAPYEPLACAAEMSLANYPATTGMTPLYRESIVTLGTVIAKARECEAAEQQVRTFTLLMTDGHDNDKSRTRAADVAGLVKAMIASRRHIIAGMGIGDEADFRAIFDAMGIPARWILTADSTPEDIGRTFRTIADSLAIAATSERSFAQLTAGPPGAS